MSRGSSRSSPASGTGTGTVGLPPVSATVTPRVAEPPPEYRPPTFEGLGMRASASLMRSMCFRPLGHPMTTRSRGIPHVEHRHDRHELAHMDSTMSRTHETSINVQDAVSLGVRRPALKKYRVSMSDESHAHPNTIDVNSHAESALRLSTELCNATESPVRSPSGRHPDGDVDPPSG